MRRIAANLREYGPFQVAKDIGLRSVNRVVFLKVLHGMKLDSVNPEFLSTPEGYQGVFLDYATLSRLTGRPGWELSQTFVENALASGDRCYGFQRDGVVAAYQWYSTRPTPTDWRGLVASCSRDYVYMYKGFTHPDHRGCGLYPTGVTVALAHYLELGYRGLISLVESNNFASLKSCYRMGYKDFGKIRLAAAFNHCLMSIDKGCKAHDLRLTGPRELAFPQGERSRS